MVLVCSLYSAVSYAGSSDVTPFEPIPVMSAKLGYQISLDDNNVRSDSSLVGLYAGMQLDPSWIWDVGVQYHNDQDFDNAKFDTLLLDSGVRYTTNFEGDIDLYGRLAIGYWSVKSDHPAYYDSSTSGLSPVMEGGVSYQLNPQLSVSLGYQYISWLGKKTQREFNSHAILLGFNYAFIPSSQLSSVSSQIEPAPSSNITETPPSAVEGSVESKKELVSEEESSSKLAKPKPVIKQFAHTVIGSTYFDSNSIQVSPQTELYLLIVEDLLNTYPQSRLKVVGHTDSIGSEDDNQALSERRAKAVSEQIIGRGIDAEQLQIIGVGELDPVADNKTESGRSLNRRVELIALPFDYAEPVDTTNSDLLPVQ